MSEYNFSVAEKQTGFSGKNLPVDFGGRVRAIHASYTGTGSETAGSKLVIARLPQGARVLPISQLHFEAGQNASLTVKVGDAADDDRYFAAAAPGANAATVTLGANALGDFVTAAETPLVIVTGAQTLASGKKIVADIFYVVD